MCFWWKKIPNMLYLPHLERLEKYAAVSELTIK